jgi:3-hydroxyacyl-CoA dehydrogenase
MHHTQALGLSLDLVDALTGPAIGRPRSATYRTADLVGLDTMDHVIRGSALALRQDPWRHYFTVPDWLNALLEKGALGQKTRAGIYADKGKQVLDPATGDYRDAGAKPDEAVRALLKIKNPAEKFAALRASEHPQAQFLWAIHRDVFHYAAVLLAEIADTARDVDFAIRWGFGWSMGPFEIWQAVGWRQVVAWIEEDIAAGKAMTATPLPAWVKQVDGVHRPEGSYSAAEDAYKPRSTLPVYRRQLYPEQVLGEAPPRYGEAAFENSGRAAVDHRRRHRRAELQEQAARHRRRGAGRSAGGTEDRRAAFRRSGAVADRSAVQRRGQSGPSTAGAAGRRCRGVRRRRRQVPTHHRARCAMRRCRWWRPRKDWRSAVAASS